MNDTAPQEPNPSPETQRPPRFTGLRRWLPLAVIALEGFGLLTIQYLENAEIVPPAEAFLTKISIIGLGTILIFLWFVFLAPAAPTLRRRVGIIGLLAVLFCLATVRVEGVSGDIHLRLKWAWSPATDATLPTAASEAAPNAEVNLAATTPYDSPQFLGANRDATLPDANLARDWSQEKPKLLWRQPIGAGWSSFAIVGHYGVTQEQRGEEELVTCYDLDDGKLQWAHATPVRFHEILAGIGPRATPAVDEGKVYALGALGHLVCLDGATGKLLWQHDIVTENGAGQPQWGRSGSPLVHENLVIASAGGPGGKSLVAYDKNDGKLVWSAGDDASSYASPTLMTLCGVPQIVMVNEKLTSGHDPSDGHILWEHIWPEGGIASPNVAQPIAVGGDQILLTKGYGVGSTLWQIKCETSDEGADQWSVEPLWKSNNLKTKMTSAVVRDGYAYGLDEGTLSCLEVATGKKMWKRSRFGHGQVLLVGDVLLVQSEDGQIALAEASPDKYVELARMPVVEGQSWNYPALSGRKLVVRTQQEVACYELPAVSP